MEESNSLERNAYTISNGDELDISDVWKSLIYGKSNVIRNLIIILLMVIT